MAAAGFSLTTGFTEVGLSGGGLVLSPSSYTFEKLRQASQNFRRETEKISGISWMEELNKRQEAAAVSRLGWAEYDGIERVLKRNGGTVELGTADCSLTTMSIERHLC